MSDEIEFFRDGKSQYKAPLPNFSNNRVRIAIAKRSGGKVNRPDRIVILTDGIVRVDSNNSFILKMDCRILRKRR